MLLEKVGLNEYTKFKPAIYRLNHYLPLRRYDYRNLFGMSITVKKIFLFKECNYPNYSLFYGRHNSISFSDLSFYSLASTLLSLMCLLLYITSWSISIWMVLSLFYNHYMLQEFFISKFFYLITVIGFTHYLRSEIN